MGLVFLGRDAAALPLMFSGLLIIFSSILCIDPSVINAVANEAVGFTNELRRHVARYPHLAVRLIIAGRLRGLNIAVLSKFFERCDRCSSILVPVVEACASEKPSKIGHSNQTDSKPQYPTASGDGFRAI